MFNLPFTLYEHNTIELQIMQDRESSPKVWY